MDATNKTKTPSTTLLTKAPASTLLATPVGSGPEAVIHHVERAYLVRPHALYLSSTDPEHPIGTAIGGSLVPPISPSAWPYVAYLADGASPLPAAAGAEEPALAPQITACFALSGRSPPAITSYLGITLL